ncbi:carbohydrate porin [Escherichia coli]
MTFTPPQVGYQRVDYDKGGDNSGWKSNAVTEHFYCDGPGFCPMLRFYMTGGQVDNDRTARVNGTKEETLDDFNLGAMWEAWFDRPLTLS